MLVLGLRTLAFNLNGVHVALLRVEHHDGWRIKFFKVEDDADVVVRMATLKKFNLGMCAPNRSVELSLFARPVVFSAIGPLAIIFDHNSDDLALGVVIESITVRRDTNHSVKIGSISAPPRAIRKFRSGPGAVVVRFHEIDVSRIQAA